MPVTVIGKPVKAIPLWVGRAVVDLKRDWADDWEFWPDVEVVALQVHTGTSGIGECNFRIRYGSEVKWPWTDKFRNVPSEFLNDWWVRVRIVGEDAQPEDLNVDIDHVAFVGRVSTEARDVFQGTDDPGGRQDWIAYDGTRVLQRVWISKSHWWDQSAERTVDWLPDFNARDDRRQLVGNRSAAKHGGTYVFDATNTDTATNLWSRFDILEYLIARFMDDTSSTGPEWKITGEVLDVLKGVYEETPADDKGDPQPPTEVQRDLASDVIRMRPVITVHEALAEVLSPRIGVDYRVRPTDDGFEINVFALQPEEESAPEAFTLPRNSNLVEVTAGSAVDLIRNTIVQGVDSRYDRVRLIGRRIIICCTLRGAKAAPDGVATLVPKWSPGLEALYELGTGEPGTPVGTPANNDRVRRSERFKTVYGVFGAPAGWDFNQWTAIIQLDGDGNIVTTNDQTRHQRAVRSTLTWTPIEEGVDYSPVPSEGVDRTHALAIPEFMPPAVWFKTQPGKELFGLQYWTNAEDLGINVHALRNDWGVLLTGWPNHRIALNHFDDTFATDFPPQFDYDDMICTLAFTSDTRFELVAESANPNKPARADNELVIEAPDAELWYIAPNTVVGMGADLQPLTLRAGLVVRDDTSRLRLTMAGLQARHLDERGRASVTFKGVLAAHDLVGQILTVVEEGGDTHQIRAPITSAVWNFGPDPTTTFLAGFAS